MSVFPVRNLAKYGVLTDPDPYDLPTEAFSLGVNVRFLNGKITRGPVFRSVQTLGTSNPRFVVGATPTTGQDFVFIGYRNGKLYRYQNSTETDYSIASYSVNDVEATWTSCHLADVLYVNRSDRTPWYFRASDSAFNNIAAGGSPAWNAGWTTKLLRSCGNALIALNVTKSGTNIPTMVKTSSFPTSGTIPASWDQTTPSTNATENILAEMKGAIVDACALRNNMFIYGLEETWLMQFVGGSDIWDYSIVFQNKGALNANCVIEINGQHIVFGPDDIWKHDGVTPVSICEGRVREFIYGGLNASKATQCYVVHHSQLKELQFCYVSGDRATGFSGTDGCNRAATWNYERDTWTFDDLPFAYFGSRANLDTALTYATATQTYDTVGGTYQDQEDTFKKSTVYVGRSDAGAGLSNKLYAFDPVGPLSQVSSAVDTVATKNMYLERDGIDLDEVGADLVGYKICQSIVPQGRLDPTAAPIQFTVGSADYYNAVADFAAYQTWDGASLYKVDYNKAGRYLSLRILFPDYRFVSLSGYDADLDVLAER